MKSQFKAQQSTEQSTELQTQYHFHIMLSAATLAPRSGREPGGGETV